MCAVCVDDQTRAMDSEDQGGLSGLDLPAQESRIDVSQNLGDTLWNRCRHLKALYDGCDSLCYKNLVAEGFTTRYFGLLLV